MDPQISVLESPDSLNIEGGQLDREDGELVSSVPDESSSDDDQVVDAPVVVVPEPPELPAEDVSGEADYSLNDVLDAFASGWSAGLSGGPSSDDQLAGELVDQPGDQPVDQPSDVSESVLDEPVCVGVETFSLSPVTSSEGLKGVLLDVLGPYDTVVTQYKYQQGSNQYYSYVNDIQPDYPWIASAVLFILLLCCSFRFLGRCFSWMK